MPARLMLLSVVLVVACMHFMVSAGQDSRLQKRSSVRACGRSLSQLISFVCQGVYNEPVATKRNSQFMLPEIDWTSEGNTIPEIDDYIFPMIRTRRGVVDECCHRSCTFSTLRSYCGVIPNGEEKSD
ncbi:hypothetical protein JTE90_025427 [Oedothorax gibbosus]|uniref:Insulin-like domain-containing protein n=1 Tax=Oedothorax gibbosus TaxID=931172 RepID=A0AAV6U8J9_9ARAC|nr:hypothetical protein JTE90_025427 [Oedothorax gibbosus]